MRRWMAGGRWIGIEGRPAVMGIVNATPDSFADGNPCRSTLDLVDHAARLIAAGADILDIGGESTRPGAIPVGLQEELDRVIPVLEALNQRFDCPTSVDTTKPQVARAALGAGAAIVNDITGLVDPEMVAVVAAADLGVVIMHIQGTPATMQDNPTYGEVVGEVRDALARRVELAARAGIARERIAVDPGIGFGKTFDHNLALLRRLGELAGFGCPILVGTSRKGFLGRITGRPIAERQAASVASALAAAARGASIVRVHDVRMTVDALNVWHAQVGWS